MGYFRGIFGDVARQIFDYWGIFVEQVAIGEAIRVLATGKNDDDGGFLNKEG